MMTVEALFVLMVLFGYGVVLMAAAVVFVVVMTFIAAVLNNRSMGHSNTWRGKLGYAISHIFG